MQAPGRLGSGVTSDPTRERKSLEQELHSSGILGHVRVDFRIRAFEISLGYNGRCSMARPRDEDGVQVPFLDESVEVDVGEHLAWIGAPVAEQALLEVLGLQGFFQQCVGFQIEHANAQIQAGPKIGVGVAKLFLAEGRVLHRGASLSIAGDALLFADFIGHDRGTVGSSKG